MSHGLVWHCSMETSKVPPAAVTSSEMGLRAGVCGRLNLAEQG